MTSAAVFWSVTLIINGDFTTTGLGDSHSVTSRYSLGPSGDGRESVLHGSSSLLSRLLDMTGTRQGCLAGGIDYLYSFRSGLPGRKSVITKAAWLDSFQGCLDSCGFYSSRRIHELRELWIIQHEESSAGGGLCVDSRFLLAPQPTIVIGIVCLTV